MSFLTVLFSRHVSYKQPTPFPHFLLLKIMVLLLYDESWRLELVADEMTNTLKYVWLHCSRWDWTCRLNHLSARLLLNAEWVDAGACWTLLSVSSLKANLEWRSLSFCASSGSVYFGKGNWKIASFLLNLLIPQMRFTFCVWCRIFLLLILLCIRSWKREL